MDNGSMQIIGKMIL